MALFSADADSSTSIDNSVTDASTNTNNAGALQAGGDLTITDGGAFDVANNAIQSNQSVLDRSLEEVGETVKVTSRTTSDTIGQALAVANERGKTNTDKLMETLTKVALGIGGVVAVGFIANAWGKK